jgi:hypothetical protein
MTRTAHYNNSKILLLSHTGMVIENKYVLANLQHALKLLKLISATEIPTKLRGKTLESNSMLH